MMGQSGEALSIRGDTVKANQEMLILLQAMHHHPDYWNNPSVFDASRWNRPLREPRAYIPFLTVRDNVLPPPSRVTLCDHT